MKKIISIAVLSLGLAGLTVNIANAANFKVTGNDVCSALSYRGFSSKFVSDDEAMDALLNYRADWGDGVSGGFGAVVDAVHHTAPITDSHCNDGIVTINWDTENFSGSVTGRIDIPGNRIADVNGIINGKEVHNDLMFRDYE